MKSTMKSTIVAAVCSAASILCVAGAFGHDQPDAAGGVSFPVSCTPEAQKRFNAAASLLYSFHWGRVDKALAEVLEVDPACAMVYWAKAVANLDNALGSPPTPKKEKEGWAAV